MCRESRAIRKWPLRVYRIVFCRDWRPRQSGPSGRPVPTGLHEQCGYVGLPQEGCPRLRRARRYAASRQSREGGPSKMVDEDVGSRFAGKCFGVRSFEDVRRFIIRRGSRAIPHLAPRAKSPLRVCALFFCRDWRPRQSGPSGRPVPTGLHEQCGYVGLPQEGCPRLRRARRYAASRQSREGGPSKMVDEDVGSRFAGKCFGVRSFEDVRRFIIRRGSRAIPHLAPRAKSPLRVYRIVFCRDWHPRQSGLSGRPVPTGLCVFYCLCTKGRNHG